MDIGETALQGVLKKATVTDFSDFLDWKHDHKLWCWKNKKMASIWLLLGR